MKAIVSAFVVMGAVLMISCAGNASKTTQADSTAVAATVACPDSCACDSAACAQTPDATK